MIAADDDRRRDFAASHHLVEGEAEAVALAEADPADPRRKAWNAIRSAPCRASGGGGNRQDQLLHLGIGFVYRDRRQRGQRNGPTRAKRGPDIGGDEAGSRRRWLRPR